MRDGYNPALHLEIIEDELARCLDGLPLKRPLWSLLWRWPHMTGADETALLRAAAAKLSRQMGGRMEVVE